MQIFYWQKHFKQAEDCLRLYAVLEQQTFILRPSLLALQHRFQAHCFALAEQPEKLPKNVDSAFQAAIVLLVKYLHKSAVPESLEIFLSDPSWFSSLYLVSKLFDIKSLIQEAAFLPGLEQYPNFFLLAAQCHISLADHLVHQGLQASKNPALQMAALAYAAQDQRYGSRVFSQFYQALFNKKSLSKSQSLLYAKALKFSMTKGETQAEKYIQQAFSMKPENFAPWCYVAALKPDLDYLPNLMSFAEQYPDPGLVYLSLTGYKAVLGGILKALKNPYTAILAAESWLILTGENIALRPGLYSIDLAGDAREQTLPDASKAEQYLAECQWSDTQRYLFGKEMNFENLQHCLNQYAGKVEQYILDLLSVNRNFSELLCIN